MTSFSELELAPEILEIVAKCGYETPTEVQARTIPLVLAGHDILATAKTGAGKTASFVLPMLHRLGAKGSGSNANRNQGGRNAARSGSDARGGMNRGTRGRTSATPTALVLAPTRELAIQIDESVRTYGAKSNMRSACVYGGAPKHGQLRSLAANPDILVATPGRLLDFISEGAIDLGGVTYLVLDEGDRMLDMGFMPDIRRIMTMLPTKRQSVLYSATLPREIETLAREFLDNPQRVECSGGSMTIDTIDQSVMFVEQDDKAKLLVKLIQDNNMFRVLVFTRTKHKASRIARLLSKERIDSDAIHGDRTQNQRKRALDSFRSGRIQALVATDVAARGIDVDDVTHVINFEMPNEAETYVHRIGRTGRAGASGSAVSLCNREEVGSLKSIERLMSSSIAVDRDHEWHVDMKPDRRGGGGRGNNSSRGGGGGSRGGSPRGGGAGPRGGGGSPRGGGGSRGGSSRGGGSPRGGDGGSRGGDGGSRGGDGGSRGGDGGSRGGQRQGRPDSKYSSREGGDSRRGSSGRPGGRSNGRRS